MADHNGPPIFPSLCNRILERAVDSFERDDVVEEDIAMRRRYQVGFSHVQRDRGGGGTAIQKVEISLFDDGHQSLHGRRRTGQQAARVIADPRQVRQPIQSGFEGTIKFLGTH